MLCKYILMVGACFNSSFSLSLTISRNISRNISFNIRSAYMNKGINKKKRDELHRLWLDVTGTAVTVIHRVDGYKGVFAAGQDYELIRPHCLQGEVLQDRAKKLD